MTAAPSDAPPAAPLSRRKLLKLAALGAAGTGLGAGAAALIVRSGGPAPAYRFLNNEEGALLAAVCEDLIPRDGSPGAADAGVVRYIDRQLAGRLRRHRASYRRGLAAFAAACRRETGQPYAALPEEARVAWLSRIESGRVPPADWGDPTAPAFFRLVLTHTMQGFYGPPRHGGNRDHASFRMLGLAYPQIIGQNRFPSP
jgi:gluconate 2-dehydrogenase gamma chain